MDRNPDIWYRPSEAEIGISAGVPFCAQTTDMAPTFSAEAWDPVEKKIKTIRLADFKGKWVILFFYASDFTFV